MSDGPVELVGDNEKLLFVTERTYKKIFAIVDHLRRGDVDRAKELAERFHEERGV